MKNDLINRILRHLADNPRLNRATNWAAVVPVVIAAALNGSADWALILSCCDDLAARREVFRVGGLVVSAVALWGCGKMRFLQSWLPATEEKKQQ